MVPFYFGLYHLFCHFCICRYFDGYDKVDYAGQVVFNCCSGGGEQGIAMYEPS